MILVGVTIVINSLDSLIRPYSDNLSITTERFGKVPYLVGNVAVLFIFLTKRQEVMDIKTSPPENELDFSKIESAH